MDESEQTPRPSIAAARVKRVDCDEMRGLEAELTLAFRRSSAALRSSRARGLIIGDADTAAAGDCIVQAWAALGEHNEKHRCR